MTEVQLPKAVWLGDIHGYSEAQLKQYGDDRAREALEMAAREIGSAGQSGSYLSKRVRELAKEIK